ncbi:MAG: hypothetical protein PHS22_15615 [Rhodoferax sp.]|nr:hypothetical protein [Rhodoferax sp.]MDD2811028.1 hypothetical protein [Rhodoferax sp.]
MQPLEVVLGKQHHEANGMQVSVKSAKQFAPILDELQRNANGCTHNAEM